MINEANKAITMYSQNFHDSDKNLEIETVFDGTKAAIIDQPQTMTKATIWDNLKSGRIDKDRKQDTTLDQSYCMRIWNCFCFCDDPDNLEQNCWNM